MKTKTGIVLAVSLMFIFVLGNVQKSNAQMFIGAQAGYLSTKIYGNDTYGGMNWNSNISGGLNFGFKVATDFNIQIDVLYSVKGTKQKFIMKDMINAYEHDTTQIYKEVTKQYDNILKLSYVEVPILFKKSFSFKGGIFPYERQVSKVDLDIFAGPYVGYLFSSSTNLNASRVVNKTVGGETSTVSSGDTTSSFLIGNETITMATGEDVPAGLIDTISSVPTIRSIANLNKIDVGIMAGIGLSVELSKRSKFTLDARYSMGFLTIDNTYFNDIEYQFYPSGEGGYTANSENFGLNKITTKMDLKNTGFGFYLGYIHYLGIED